MAQADPPDETEIVERSPCGRYSRVRARDRGLRLALHRTAGAATNIFASSCLLLPAEMDLGSDAAAPRPEVQLASGGPCKCSWSPPLAIRLTVASLKIMLPCFFCAVQSAAGPWFVQDGVQGVRRGGGNRGGVVPSQHGPCWRGGEGADSDGGGHPEVARPQGVRSEKMQRPHAKEEHISACRFGPAALRQAATGAARAGSTVRQHTAAWRGCATPRALSRPCADGTVPLARSPVGVRMREPPPSVAAGAAMRGRRLS